MRWKTSRPKKPITGSIPAAWQTAAEYLYDIQLSIVESDQAYVFQDDTDPEHLTGKATLGQRRPYRDRRNPITDAARPIQRTDYTPFQGTNKRGTVAETTKRRFSKWARGELAAARGEEELARLKLSRDQTAEQFIRNMGPKIAWKDGVPMMISSIQKNGVVKGFCLEHPEDLTKIGVKKTTVNAWELSDDRLGTKYTHEEPAGEPPDDTYGARIETANLDTIDTTRIAMTLAGDNGANQENNKRNRTSDGEPEGTDQETPKRKKPRIGQWAEDEAEGVVKWRVELGNRAVEGDLELGGTKEKRRRQLEETVEDWARDCGTGAKMYMERGSESKQSRSRIFATDGSMFPASAKPGQHRTVSGACVTEEGTIGAVVETGNAQVMHGELLGIIMALIQGRGEDLRRIVIFSDYLGAVRNIWDHESVKKQRMDAMTGDSNIFKLGGKSGEQGLDSGAGRSWYRWIFLLLDELKEAGIEIEVRHVKAHVTEESEMRPEHKLNEKADRTAKSARDPAQPSPNHCTWPTFTLDRFAMWDEKQGYIEADLYRYIKHRFRQARRDALFHSDYIMQVNTTPYKTGVHPDYMYRKSTSDYSIRTQALVRGKALYTNRKATMMYPQSNTAMCPDCPYSIENERHIFVECKTYEPAREAAAQDLVEQINKMNIPHQIREPLKTIAKSMFKDKPPWPSDQTRYFFGMIPQLDGIFDSKLPAEVTAETINDPERNTTEESRGSIRKFLHARAVRTAGYIWSLRMRNKHTRWKENQNRTTNEPVDHERIEEECTEVMEEEQEDATSGGPFTEWVEDMEKPKLLRGRRKVTETGEGEA